MNAQYIFSDLALPYLQIILNKILWDNNSNSIKDVYFVGSIVIHLCYCSFY